MNERKQQMYSSTNQEGNFKEDNIFALPTNEAAVEPRKMNGYRALNQQPHNY